MNKPTYQDVFEIVKLIPKGRVSTYGAIAAALSLKSAARWVGYALNNAHLDPAVPAHRVVNKQGLLTGRHQFPTPEFMQQYLEKDGVKVIDNQVQDFEKLFWDPLKELS